MIIKLTLTEQQADYIVNLIQADLQTRGIPAMDIAYPTIQALKESTQKRSKRNVKDQNSSGSK